jgi:hypothetical protein
MSQADAFPAADSVSTASAEPIASGASSSEPAPQDTRSIAASVFADSGESPADSPPAQTVSEPPTPVAATRDGEDDDPDYQNLLASGSMPVDRHKAVLTNARNKTRAQVEQEYRAKYGWADTFDRQRAEHGLGILNGLDKNAEHTLRTLAASLGVNLAPPPAPKEPEGPPQADLVTPDGQEVFSAKQMAKWHDWQQQQYDKKLSAIEARFTPFLQKQQLGELREAANAEAGTTLAECRAQWPQFTALEGEIKQRMKDSDALAKQHSNPSLSLSLERAYIQAFAAKGLPALQQQHATDRASQLNRKAAASSAPPGAARPVVPLRYDERSTRDIAAEVFARQA